MARLALFLLLAGCPFRTGPVLSPQDRTTRPPAEAAVSYGPLESRVEALLAEVEDADRRDRLVQLRELMLKMRGQAPTAQARVYAYVEAVLAIEERSRPMAMGEIEPMAPIIEDGVVPGPAVVPEAHAVPVEGPPLPPPDRATSLASARASLAAGRYLEAYDTLSPLTDGEAKLLRQEAVDGWARAERERVGQVFLAARALPPGPDRTTQLTAARDALAEVNRRFPANAYAPQIDENLALIEAELTR